MRLAYVTSTLSVVLIELWATNISPVLTTDRKNPNVAPEKKATELQFQFEIGFSTKYSLRTVFTFHSPQYRSQRLHKPMFIIMINQGI